MTDIKNKKIGLALGGGAVLGAAHIGVLRSIEEQELKVDYISGTSIGALVGALYAFGKGWEEIKEIAVDMDWFDISELSISQYGLLNNKKIGDIIRDNLGDVDFKDSNIPLSIIATDISNGTKEVLTDGSITDAVMASTCLPGIFSPVEMNDKLLVDGGVLENVPVLSLQEMGADYIIGVDLNACYSFVKPENIIEVIINTVNLALINASKLQTEKADLLLTPDLSHFNLYATDQVPELIEIGYKECNKALKELVDK